MVDSYKGVGSIRVLRLRRWEKEKRDRGLFMRWVALLICGFWSNSGRDDNKLVSPGLSVHFLVLIEISNCQHCRAGQRRGLRPKITSGGGNHSCVPLFTVAQQTV